MRRPHDGATLSTSSFTVTLRSGFSKTTDGAVSKAASTTWCMFIVRVKCSPSFLICCSQTQRHTVTKERYLAAQSWLAGEDGLSGAANSCQVRSRSELNSHWLVSVEKESRWDGCLGKDDRPTNMLNNSRYRCSFVNLIWGIFFVVLVLRVNVVI